MLYVSKKLQSSPLVLIVPLNIKLALYLDRITDLAYNSVKLPLFKPSVNFQSTPLVLYDLIKLDSLKPLKADDMLSLISWSLAFLVALLVTTYISLLSSTCIHISSRYNLWLGLIKNSTDNLPIPGNPEIPKSPGSTINISKLDAPR